MPDSISIRDVGPRDGLQPEEPLAVEQRVALVASLAAAGVVDIEVAAFVSPAAVPAMAGAAEVCRSLERSAGVRHWALVPNVRGANDAVAAGVDAITVTVSASETYSQANVKRSTEDSVAGVADIVRAAGDLEVDTVISCAFGSPYDEQIGPFDVAAIVEQVREAGSTHVTLADTTGIATPERIADVVTAVGPDVRLHLHDTRGTALANAFAALLLGVTAFDTAVGGLGGSPFAAGAGGNLATEDLVHLCDGLGIDTGIDLSAMVGVATTVSGLIGRPVPSRVTATLGA
ncbi:hydroxymethylglutaryl-CoA lyase [Actinospongicola halichondriae]|uniref:hydroxymethylglutaryl-CoA lyase n=1 Tax=Actinospongicola halichondriae TaxID=3236844 RepID=UPI003D4D8394